MGFSAFIVRKYLILVNVGERGPPTLLSKPFCVDEAERVSFYRAQRRETICLKSCKQVRVQSQDQQPCLSVVPCY